MPNYSTPEKGDGQERFWRGRRIGPRICRAAVNAYNSRALRPTNLAKVARLARYQRRRSCGTMGSAYPIGKSNQSRLRQRKLWLRP